MEKNWQDFPVLRVTAPTNPGEPLQIVGTLEGLGQLVQAIAYAMGDGQQEADVLHPNADPYTVSVQRIDQAQQWSCYPGEGREA